MARLKWEKNQLEDVAAICRQSGGEGWSERCRRRDGWVKGRDRLRRQFRGLARTMGREGAENAVKKSAGFMGRDRERRGRRTQIDGKRGRRIHRRNDRKTRL